VENEFLMKLTIRQLRQLINETIFAGGPTVDSPDKSVGVTVDMGRNVPPKVSKEYQRDKEVRLADPKLRDLMDSDSESFREMARQLADTAYGIPSEIKLEPEEEYAQGLFDEFYPEDVFDEPHDMPDDRLERSYAPEIQQIKKAMKKRIEDAMDRGASSFDELYSAAYTTPGYDNLRRHLMNLPLNQRFNAKGVHSDKPEYELIFLPGELVDMYMADDNPHY
jgi:hypothetical protein